MKVLVLGSKGQLGSALKNVFSTSSDFTMTGLDKNQLNICDPIEINKNKILQIKPDIIINAVAYTQVDKAETDQSIAKQINGESLKSLSLIANDVNAELIQISTDFVFDGKKNTPYLETDLCNPISVYGQTKLLGEEMVIKNCKNYSIFRTSWLYSTSHPCFLTTMLRLAKEKNLLCIVYDQVGSPTSAKSLAEAILIYIKNRDRDKNEIYHFSNEGVCSWYDFAAAIFEIESFKINLKPILTNEYPTPAKRPAYSVLSKRKFSEALNYKNNHWHEELKEILTNSKLQQ